MRYLSISEQELRSICLYIEEYIKSLNPSHLIVIKSGGSNLLKYMDLDNLDIREVSVRHRDSVGELNSTIKLISRFLPRLILRILFRLNNLKSRRDPYREVSIPDEIMNLDGNIVILDDCIDTGVTLECLTSRIKSDYKVICVNDVTGSKSNLFMYSNCLIRFHWNIDY